MNVVDKFRGKSDVTILLDILNDKRNNICNQNTIAAIYWVFGKILAETENNILELILSDDREIRSIGIQMLLPYWVDWYTEMFNNISWRSILTGIIVGLAEITLSINDRSYIQRQRY